jgi:recombinational DNA repair protein (RecF pathway)
MSEPTHGDESCARCGDDTGPGSPLYVDRVRTDDGRILCHACAQAKRGHVTPLYPEPDVPITMPSTNLPQTH